MSEIEKEDWTFIKLMLKKHWKVGIVFILGIIGAIIGIILTLFLVIETSAIGDQGTWSIGEFSIGNIILWFLTVALWEFLIVILPTIAYMAITWGIWWSLLLDESEKQEFRERERREEKIKDKGSAASGVFGFFVFIAFLIIITIEGNLWTPIGTIPYVYWIQKILWSAFWIIIVLGIPALIAGIYYLRKKWREV